MTEFYSLNQNIQESNRRIARLEEAQQKREEEFNSVVKNLKTYLQNKSTDTAEPQTKKRKKDDFQLEIFAAVDTEISNQAGKFFFRGSVDKIEPNLLAQINNILLRHFPDPTIREQKLPFALSCVRVKN